MKYFIDLLFCVVSLWLVCVTEAGNLYHVYPPVIAKTDPQPLSLYPDLEHPYPLLSLPDLELRSKLFPSYQTSPIINLFVFITLSKPQLKELLEETQAINNKQYTQDQMSQNSPTSPTGQIEYPDSNERYGPPGQSGLTMRAGVRSVFNPRSESSVREESVNGDETVGRK